MTSGDKLEAKSDNLGLRVISALVMVPAGVCVVYVGGPVLAMACVACGLGMWREICNVSAGLSVQSPIWLLGAVLIAAVCVAITWIPEWTGLIVTVGVAVLAAIALVSRSSNSVWLISGLVFVIAAVSGLIFIRDYSPDGLIVILSLMTCVWATDIAAYFAGKGFGGPQLSPTGSPNKTWSGAAGAVICTALIGALIGGLLGAPVLPWLLFAAVLSLLAQVGDLLESYWKRRFGVKDSGTLIPGHGGILDRLDSFSCVLVCVGFLLYWLPDFPVAVLKLGDA